MLPQLNGCFPADCVEKPGNPTGRLLAEEDFFEFGGFLSPSAGSEA
jgi:hypothetical protein